MTTQRHQIQRQIIDITVSDQMTGQRLHEEFSRLQREIIEPLLDRCCSELSAPDRVHRIPRLEIDLGDLSIETLDQDLVEKLELALREALAAKILEEEQLSEMVGENPAVMAQAELISLFSRTGALPFWADSGKPRVVDEAVEKFIAADSQLLVTLVRDLSRDARALRRLLRHVEPERLRSLFELLVNAALPVGAERTNDVWELLAMRSMSTVAIESTTLWVAAMETALRGDAIALAETFLREVLGRVALEMGLAYRTMVLALFAASGGRGVGRVLRMLVEEVGGVGEKVPEKVPGTFSDVGPVVARFSGIHGTPNSPAKRAQTAGPPRERLKIRATTSIREGEKVPGTFLEMGEGEEEKVQEEKVEAESKMVPGRVEPSSMLKNQQKAPRERLPSGFEPSQTPSVGKIKWFRTTSDPLASASQVVSNHSGPARSDIPSGLDSSQATHPGVSDGFEPPTNTAGSSVDASPPRQDANELTSEPSDPTKEPSGQSFEPSGQSFEPSGQSFEPSGQTFVPSGQTFRHAPVPFGQPPVSFDTSSQTQHRGARTSGPTAPSTVAKSPTNGDRSAPKPRPSTIHEDLDQIYVDTSGLVLLWPFLNTYFDRLELLANKKSFIDESARARAVLLLHYLATTEPDPPEYRLTLAKVLCGMPFEALFAAPSEPTETEIVESANVLSAALQHANIFGEVSIDDFRRAFLLRRGILSTRDGAWLLRVERAPYDLILQQLPWPIAWVRLPWMEAPLHVEWIR